MFVKNFSVLLKTDSPDTDRLRRDEVLLLLDEVPLMFDEVLLLLEESHGCSRNRTVFELTLSSPSP